MWLPTLLLPPGDTGCSQCQDNPKLQGHGLCWAMCVHICVSARKEDSPSPDPAASPAARGGPQHPWGGPWPALPIPPPIPLPSRPSREIMVETSEPLASGRAGGDEMGEPAWGSCCPSLCGPAPHVRVCRRGRGTAQHGLARVAWRGARAGCPPGRGRKRCFAL